MKQYGGILIIIILLVIVFGYSYNFVNGKPSTENDSDYQTEVTEEQTSTDNSNTESEYSSEYCAECGKPCLKRKQIYSSGDIVSNNEPYYVCGNMPCVQSRYQKDIQMQNSSNDGRVYDNEPCSLCQGTGIEKNNSSLTEEYGRVCPQCDGKGHQSY